MKNIKVELSVDGNTDQVAKNSAEQVAGEEKAEQLAGEVKSAEQVANNKFAPGVAAIIGAMKDRQREKADERKALKAKAKAMALTQPAAVDSEAQPSAKQPAAGASEAQPSAKSQAQGATAADLETKRTKEKHRFIRMLQETTADKESTPAKKKRLHRSDACNEATPAKKQEATPANKPQEATPAKRQRLHKKPHNDVMTNGSKIRVSEPKMQHETICGKKT